MDEISSFVNDVVEAPAVEAPAVEAPVEEAVNAAVEATIEANAPVASSPKVPPIVGVMGVYALGALVSIAVYGAVSLAAKGVQIGMEKIKERIEKKREAKIIIEEAEPCMDEEEENN